MSEQDKYLFKPLSYLENLGQDVETDSYVAFMRNEIKAYPAIRNIGVIGPYGSGKSSVVHSFLKNENKDEEYTLFFSQETIAEHLLSNDNDGTFHERVKKAIYLELLKYDTSSILLKEYNECLLNKRKWRSIVASIAFGIASLCLSFVLFAFLFFVKRWELYVALPLAFALLNIFAILFFTFYIRSITLSLHSNKADANVEMLPVKNYRDISEQINNHPTELDNLILYIIDRNKIRYFVIEDMERLGEKAKGRTFEIKGDDSKTDIVLEIIKQFKILNDLIDRSKVVKQKVRFIYGLNDECFTDSEIRSKFFDLIVPIVPLATYSSAAQAIADDPFVKELIDGGNLSNITINIISLHFKNQRQINAFLSQFYLNCQKLAHSQGYDKIFAVTSLMVLFPHFSHSLYEKNNSLDLLLSQEWFVDSNGKPSLASGKPFPEDVIKDKDSHLPVFLKICITKNLITKSYRLFLTSHSVADNKILSDKDVELLYAFYSGGDIDEERFDNPENVLERIDDEEFTNKPYNFHPQLLDCMVAQNDKHRLKLFKESMDGITDIEDKEDLFMLLINQCSGMTARHIAEAYSDSIFIYNLAPTLKEDRNTYFAFVLLISAKPDFLKNNRNTLGKYFVFVSSSTFLNSKKDNLNSALVEKLINSEGFVAENISILSENKTIMSAFKKKPKFKMNFENLFSLFPDFKSHPFEVLNANKEVCEAFMMSNNSASILENCDLEKNYNAFAVFLINRPINSSINNLLDSKYFDNWRFKIVLGNTGGLEVSLDYSRINLLFTHNLLELNYAYSKWYLANDPSTFIAHIKNSFDLIAQYKPSFNSDLSDFLFKHLAKEELSKIGDLLSYEFITKNVASLNVDKIMALFDCIDSDNAKQLLAKSAIENESLFTAIIENKKVELEKAEDIVINKSEMTNIFNKNLVNYYSLLLTSKNADLFKQFIGAAEAKKDFAKLIFLGDGALRPNTCIISLAEVCKYEISNTGALEKVFNQIDDESLKNNAWISFIDAYVDKYGSQEKFNKLSLHRGGLNELIYNRFIKIKRLSATKGQGNNKSKLYFILNNEEILF